MAEEQRISIICGPTGSGKTRVALELAEKSPTEIVSADSRQIIRHLDIGTAKPTGQEQQRVRFHLIDLIEPGQRYSAFQFVEDADLALQEILMKGHRPLVVGGTGLYLRALTEGVVEIEEDDTREVRRKLELDMEQLGPKEMHRRLAQVDPEEARNIHPNNKVRVIRALEICQLTGRSKSALLASGAYRKSRFGFDYCCLVPPRSELYASINARVDRMIRDGLLVELERLIVAGQKEKIRSARIIGYDELLDVLDGHLLLKQAVDLIKRNTRRYAKRQMTWFRHQARCQFFPDRQSLIRAISPG